MFNQLDDKIVIFGMSCVGKTTFAKTMKDHDYYCFDGLFQWNVIETLGLSITSNLNHVKQICKGKFVLDGWHLSDKSGKYLPDLSCVYVLWAPYEKIINQYRVPVHNPDEHRKMYKKWYLDVNYDAFQGVRYFENNGLFEEISKEQFKRQLLVS